MRCVAVRTVDLLRNFGGACCLALALAGCIDGPTAPSLKPPTPSPKALPAAAKTWLVETFESPQGTSGGFWCAFDHNGLGTKVSPDPFVLTAGGAPPSPGHSARYFGALGDNRPPYSWAQLQVFLNPTKAPADLRGFRSVRFWAKGDGGRYALVQNLSTALVVGFTFVTVGNVIALQYTEMWHISAAQFLHGLSFTLPAGSYAPMQAAFVEHDAFQCGYCTSGQIMSAVAVTKEPVGPSDDDVRQAMYGNICRCGAYPNIVAAVQAGRRHA